MKNITFITGNQKKADYLTKYLWFPVEHIKLDLDEIQSLDNQKIVEHKARQAYNKIWKPILVEDVWMRFSHLWLLPWPFIKFFLEELSPDRLCAMIPKWADRSAVGYCWFGYYDGNQFEYFEWSIKGHIPEKPWYDNGFGWDRIFIPEWYSLVRSELSEKDYEKVYKSIRPLDKIREFLLALAT